MAKRIQLRRGTAEEWAEANPTLAAGEIGVELDTLKVKVGNGTDDWETLEYQPTSVAAANLTGTIDGDRLPAMSTTKKGGVPATGTPAGKFLKDDATWATPAGGGGGSGLNWLGAWDADTDYEIADAVSHEGSSFIAIQAGAGHEPAVGGNAWWDDMAVKGDDGEDGVTPVKGVDYFDGDPGDPGAPGADGKTVLSGTAVPTTEGVVGDFYLRTSTSDLYGPKTSGGWGSPVSLLGTPGQDGDDGADGNAVLYGTDAPTDGVGVDGNFYIRTSTNYLYGPKASGHWPAGTSLIGAQGNPGPNEISASTATAFTGLLKGTGSIAGVVTPATNGKMLKADASGLPADASNTDTQVANSIRMVTPQTLTDGANIDWDLAAGGAAKVTLGGNRTMNAPTNMVEGAWYRLRVIQDATGSRTLSWNAAFKWPGAVAPTLTTSANAIDIFLFTTDGTYLYCIGATFDVK